MFEGMGPGPEEMAYMQGERATVEEEMLESGAGISVDKEGGMHLELTDQQIEAARLEMEQDLSRRRYENREGAGKDSAEEIEAALESFGEELMFFSDFEYDGQGRIATETKHGKGGAQLLTIDRTYGDYGSYEFKSREKIDVNGKVLPKYHGEQRNYPSGNPLESGYQEYGPMPFSSSQFIRYEWQSFDYEGRSEVLNWGYLESFSKESETDDRGKMIYKYAYDEDGRLSARVGKGKGSFFESYEKTIFRYGSDGKVAEEITFTTKEYTKGPDKGKMEISRQSVRFKDGRPDVERRATRDRSGERVRFVRYQYDNQGRLSRKIESLVGSNEV